MSNTVRFTIDESGCSAILNWSPGRLGCHLHIGQIVSIRTDSQRVQRVRIMEHDMQVHTDPATGTQYVWVTAEVVEPSYGEQRVNISKMQRMAVGEF